MNQSPQDHQLTCPNCSEPFSIETQQRPMLYFLSRVQQVQACFDDAQSSINNALPVLNQLLLVARECLSHPPFERTRDESMITRTQVPRDNTPEAANDRAEECPHPDCSDKIRTKFTMRKNLARHYTRHLKCNDRCIYCHKSVTDGNDYISHLQKCKIESGKVPQEDINKAAHIRQQLLDRAWDELDKHSKQTGSRPKKRAKRRRGLSQPPPTEDASSDSPFPGPRPGEASAGHANGRNSCIQEPQSRSDYHITGHQQNWVTASGPSTDYPADAAFQTLDTQYAVDDSLGLIRPPFASYTMDMDQTFERLPFLATPQTSEVFVASVSKVGSLNSSHPRDMYLDSALPASYSNPDTFKLANQSQAVESHFDSSPIAGIRPGAL